MATMCGTWKQETPFTNMEGILDAVGMTDPQIRGMICSLKPEIQISESGGLWEVRMITPHNTRVVSFTSGQEVDSMSVIGKPVKSTVTIDGNVMQEIHRDPDNPSTEMTHITRAFDGDEMTVTIKVDTVESVTKYRRAA